MIGGDKMSKESENTLEARTEEFVKIYLRDAKTIRKKYKLNKMESMLVLNRFELAKIHSHIDDFLEGQKPKRKKKEK